jgi:uncharacterized protein YdhG (YjbR/CyaY superfamily)
LSAQDADDYLQGIDEPKRVAAFGVQRKTIAGFAAFKDHLSYLPFSGSVLRDLADELQGYTMTRSALHFPVDRPLPKTLVRS